MESRINVQVKGQNALKTIFGIGAYLKKSSIERQLLELVNLRVSQINNCAYCLDMHAKELIEMGETTQRIYSISAWEETPYYSSRERAAFAWAEAITKCHVGNDVYRKAIAEFREEELIDLTLSITTINTWNRFNLAFPTKAGAYRVGQFG